MSQNQSNLLAISKRRLMLYKAIQEFPDNQQIRNTLIRTYATQHLQVASQSGVFIGYNRADELFALELDTKLRQAGINVWMDAIDVDPDEDWEYAVSNAVNRCGVMILVLSSHAVDDEELHQVFGSFMETGKVVIPVIHESCDISSLDLIVPPIDFSRKFASGLRLLVQALTGQPTVNVS